MPPEPPEPQGKIWKNRLRTLRFIIKDSFNLLSVNGIINNYGIENVTFLPAQGFNKPAWYSNIVSFANRLLIGSLSHSLLKLNLLHKVITNAMIPLKHLKTFSSEICDRFINYVLEIYHRKVC